MSNPSSSILLEADRRERRAVRFWSGDPVRALFMESDPTESGLISTWERSLVHGVDPVITTRTMPDFGALRADLGLTVEEVAEILEVAPLVVEGIERGWKELTLQGVLWCALRLGVPVGAFFHDDDFRVRPLTREYVAFLKADSEQLHL